MKRKRKCQKRDPPLRMDENCDTGGLNISPKKTEGDESDSSFLGNYSSDTGGLNISPKKTEGDKSDSSFLGNYSSDTGGLNISPKKTEGDRGLLSPITRLTRGKEYPIVAGERVSKKEADIYPEQFFWVYNWSVKSESGRWKTQSKSVPRSRLEAVRSAIEKGKHYSEILEIIRAQK
ncbi:UNVERIFIED_CONTAM: hypothetical protein BEN50_19290 [Euhalothece sp. KZN 001]